MKKVLNFIIKSIFSGVFFAFGVIVLYAATNTITNLGGNNINSGDKIGTGWYQDVDNNLSRIYAGWVDIDGGSSSGPVIVNGPDGWSVNKIGNGKYEIIHNLGLNKPQNLILIGGNHFTDSVMGYSHKSSTSNKALLTNWDVTNYHNNDSSQSNGYSNQNFQFSFINLEE